MNQSIEISEYFLKITDLASGRLDLAAIQALGASRRQARVRALSKLPCARDNCIGVGALSRHRRWRGLGAFVCDGIARETVEGRGAVSGSLAGIGRLKVTLHDFVREVQPERVVVA